MSPDPIRPLTALKMALFNAIASSPLVHYRFRTLLARAAGMKVELRSAIMPRTVFRTNRFRLGHRSTINWDCFFDNRAEVTIGNRVGVGAGVRFITSNHDYSNPECRAGLGSLAPIVVGDGAWIGSNVTVLSGVTIGAGVVIAAGSVVRQDCEPHALYAGVPARKVRDLNVRESGDVG